MSTNGTGKTGNTKLASTVPRGVHSESERHAETMHNSYSNRLFLEPLAREHLPAVLRSVGPVVDGLYPQGRRLFEARLGDVVEGRARCTVAVKRGSVVAVAVESPKGARRLKLSTLWVHPLYRRRGVGTALLGGVVADWLERDLERVHLTVCLNEYDGILGLLHNFGFHHLTVERNRYGDGRDEAVLIWTPDFCQSAPVMADPGCKTSTDLLAASVGGARTSVVWQAA